MEAKHTPGPWEACEPGDYGDFDGYSRVVCSVGDVPLRIAVVHWHDSPDWREENDANALLIAAAPDLLEEGADALDTMERLRADLNEDDAERHAQRIAVLDLNIARLRAAIDKAHGEDR